MQLGASPHVIRWDIVCLSPLSPTSVWESFHIFIMARHHPFCRPTISQFKLLQWLIVLLAKCLFGTSHATQLIVHRECSSTHNVVRASCFKVLRYWCVSAYIYVGRGKWKQLFTRGCGQTELWSRLHNPSQSTALEQNGIVAPHTTHCRVGPSIAISQVWIAYILVATIWSLNIFIFFTTPQFTQLYLVIDSTWWNLSE